VPNFKARQQSELDRLLCNRIGSGDDRLARDDRRGRRQCDHRQQSPFRIEQKEWIFDRLLIRKHKTTLAEIVDRQGGQGHAEPGRADRTSTEVAEIGIQRLGTRDDQENRTEGDKPDHAMAHQEAQTI
jgi:hypothetical protein